MNFPEVVFKIRQHVMELGRYFQDDLCKLRLLLTMTFRKSLSLSCHDLAEEEMRIINFFPHLLVLEQTLNGKYCRFQMSRCHCHLLQQQESSVVTRNHVSPRKHRPLSDRNNNCLLSSLSDSLTA